MTKGYNLQRIVNELKIDEAAVTKISETIESHLKDYPLPADDAVVVERYENCIVVHACFGNLVNETLGIALAALISSKHGVNVAVQADPYRIALICPFKMSPHTIASELAKLKPEELEETVSAAIEGTDLFAWRHWHVAKRFGAIEKTADYKSSRARLLVNIFRGSLINKEAKREIFLEKLDIENARSILQKIASGSIPIKVAEQKGQGCSPLATPIIDKIIPHDLLRPAVPTESLAEIVKERLLSQNVRLVCIFNADWEGIRAVRTLPERIKCPICNSTLIAITYPGDEALLGIAKRKVRAQALSKEEQHAWDRAWHSASLVQTAGKKAVIAMSARGVGPTTAARVLRKFYRNENDFYIEILKAEREYARTRLFWG